jgi:cytoskeletal protein CcmA (bactofilin family)
MGFFGQRGKAPAAQRGGTTVVAEGTRIHGELSLEGKLHIDGRVEGSIHCRGDVSIGPKGRFEGGVEAETLVVAGEVEGRVSCTGVEIVAGGRLQGEVSSESLVIAPGGQFIGESASRTDEVVTRPEREPEAPTESSHDPRPTTTAPAG